MAAARRRSTGGPASRVASARRGGPMAPVIATGAAAVEGSRTAIETGASDGTGVAASIAARGSIPPRLAR